MTDRDQVPLLKGTLDVLVLRALCWTPMHGFEISRWLEDRSGDSLELDESALYQALYRMERRGLVEAEWGVTENNRRARYYAPTLAGRAHLEAETTRWLRFSRTVTAILAPAGA